MAGPRMSDGKAIIFGFVNDSEKGPMLVVGNQVAVGACIDLCAQAKAHFEALWRSAIESKTKELKVGEAPEPSRILRLQ